ncbi:MAG: transglycosylase domain-containing protein, partial [Patescibacteria group bacterium]|nr:transglycosylase domain-containing protein [Patescibacteria group bacterium]
MPKQSKKTNRKNKKTSHQRKPDVYWKSVLSPFQKKSPLPLVGIAMLFLSFIGILLYFFIFKDLPSPTKLGDYDIPLSTKIYDRNGTLLFTIFAEQNRTYVPLSEIPKHLQQATIAIEDKNFYKHQGINPIGGMLRAAIATITGRQLQGGSTITQQLVKGALLTSERTVQRKLREIILALLVET